MKFKPTMRNVTVFIIVILAILIITQQNSYARQFHKKGHDDCGRWALQFGIARDIQLSDFQGTMISLKYNLTRKSALRLGLAVDFEASDFEDSQDNTGYSYFDTHYIDGDINDRRLELNLQYIYSAGTVSRLKFFLGSGPVIMYSDYEKEGSGRVTKDDSSAASYYLNKEETWALGIAAIVGVEWFAYKGISLTAEYGSTFEYRYLQAESTENNYYYFGRTESTDTEETGYYFDRSRVRFGLSLYF
jgi:hypothetical protein